MAFTEDGGQRVLLVGDAEHLSGALDDYLQETGFLTDRVTSAGDCLARLERDSVNRSICGFDLPDLNGLQLLRSIRVSSPYLPFILVTSHGSESLAGDATAAGARVRPQR